MRHDVYPEATGGATGTATAEATAQAVAAAAAAARRAGVEVRELDSPEATHAAMDLFIDVWQVAATAAPVSSDLMRAMARAGNYVVGAYAGEPGEPGPPRRLVGASVAFFADGLPRELHSHITGIVPGLQGRSVGFALKLHQRAWALTRGITTVTWTVDPLVRRNVFFNLAKLGARAVEYLPKFYGAMGDGVNADDESDRLYISWPLTSERVVAASEGSPWVIQSAALAPEGPARLLDIGPDGHPVVGESGRAVLYCQIPADILAVRAADPALALAWRHALRDTLGAALEEGYQVVGVTREGCYVLA